MDKKILVTYFSWSGNTKSIAQKIQAQTGGNIFQIVPEKSYPAEYHDATVVAKQEKENNTLPALKSQIDIKGYDVIFVGTPAWWYTMAPPVKTFLTSNNFENKVIVPFITHGGGGCYTIDKDMAQLAKGAKVLTSFIAYGNSATDKDIVDWLKSLDY